MEAAQTVVRDELASVVPMFRNTIAFTVTLQAVQSIVADNGRVTVLLGIAAAAAVAILLAVRRAIPPAGGRAIQFAAHLLDLTSQVAVQFLSNLIAVAVAAIFSHATTVWWVIVFAAFSVGLLWTATARGLP